MQHAAHHCFLAGLAKELRPIVQELNMNRGQKESLLADAALEYERHGAFIEVVPLS